MKSVLFIALLLCICLTIRAQEVFIDNKTLDTCLFLGGINVDNRKELKVIENGNISFKNSDNLSQIGLLTKDEFINEVFKQGLCFELKGYEPFWNITLLKDKIIVLDMKSGERVEYAVKLHTDAHSLSSVFFVMFSAADGEVFGTINNIGLLPNEKKQCICEYTIPETEDSLLEAYVYMKGRIYKGCLAIDKYSAD